MGAGQLAPSFNGGRMLYRVKRRMYEAMKHYEEGQEIELDDDRARALRGMVEPITREMPSAPVDREMKKRKRK